MDAARKGTYALVCCSLRKRGDKVVIRFVTPTTPLSLRMICSAASRSEDESTCPERVTCPFSASTWIEL